jgi:hypothetical protein
MPFTGANRPPVGLTMVRVSLPAPPVTASCVTPEKATAGPPLML